MLDLNDFDEAHPGYWEWDLRRLVASVHVAGRQNQMREEQCCDAVVACVNAYRDELAQLAEVPAGSQLHPGRPEPPERDGQRAEPA